MTSLFPVIIPDHSIMMKGDNNKDYSPIHGSIPVLKSECEIHRYSTLQCGYHIDHHIHQEEYNDIDQIPHFIID